MNFNKMCPLKILECAPFKQWIWIKYAPSKQNKINLCYSAFLFGKILKYDFESNLPPENNDFESNNVKCAEAISLKVRNKYMEKLKYLR